MKQGRATRDVNESSKREPIPHAVSVEHVTNIGQRYVYHGQPPGLYKSDGYKAPLHSCATHKSGSQGRYK